MKSLDEIPYLFNIYEGRLIVLLSTIIVHCNVLQSNDMFNIVKLA